MIDESDEQMVAWARSVVPGVSVTVAPPPARAGTAGVYITLVTIAPASPPRTTRRPPRELALDYLVSTAGDDVAEAHGWLGALAFAAMDVHTWRVPADPIPLQLWQAFDAVPRPAFIVRVPLRVQEADEPTPLVRKPLVVEASAVASITGRVIGPGAMPIAGANVLLPALHRAMKTDADGAFAFGAVPAGESISVVVRAKGQVLHVSGKAGEELRVELAEKDLEG